MSCRRGRRSMRTLVVGRCLSACRAMLAAAALMPSGRLWVTSAVRCPKSSASSSEEAIIPAGEQRMAAPLPKLL